MRPADLHRAMDRLAGVVAGGTELDWVSLVNAAVDEIEDLRDPHIPGPLARWVRSVIGR